MVSKISLIATTTTGAENLKNQFFLLNKVENYMFRKIFKRELLEDPVTITLELKNPAVKGLVKPEDLINRIETEMLKLGCIRGQDYDIEVSE